MASLSLDTSDLDQYIGKPMQPGRMVEPVANNDIRRWVQAMHYPNRLHYDAKYALESRHVRALGLAVAAVGLDDLAQETEEDDVFVESEVPDVHGAESTRSFGAGGDERAFVPHDDVIEGTRVGGSRSRVQRTDSVRENGEPSPFFDAHLQHGTSRIRSVNRIPIPDDELRHGIPRPRLEVLLRGPRRGRMRRDVHVDDAASVVRQHHKHSNNTRKVAVGPVKKSIEAGRET